ncbi:MAG TPA: Mur ligase family protein [Phototrophicaceae bacterium]|jgi:dihydrofolate synthase/folylpolyglutamate synthase|nr:Mur ligase family protein [Phototrophicaceae bacterium]
MLFNTESEAIDYIFSSINSTNWQARGLDENTRDIKTTGELLRRENLLDSRREYAVVTGSKGKGSVTVMTANILKHLGHTVGTVTSPHLVSYRERIRVNGKAIPSDDFVRILNQLVPIIDVIKVGLTGNQYLSPTGIFLAMALRWFDEQKVTAAVIEVGRGGRFDDNAVVPNKLSLFTPIILEHVRYLGSTLERIAWHKAGIIKPQSYAYSLPQAPEVMDVLRAEAEAQDAQFDWLAAMDMGAYRGATANGVKMLLNRYGEIDLPFIGRYEIDNATLAVWGAGNMHGRLAGVAHSSPEYVEGVRHGLETAIWPGRCQLLQTRPDVYIDGAINPHSAKLFIDSVRTRLKSPVVTIVAVPTDRDAPAVYRTLLPITDTLILTHSQRNITIKFPDETDAVAAAGEVVGEMGKAMDVLYEPTIAHAIETARARSGPDGTILMAVAQPAIGDALEFYNLHYEQI